MPPKKKPEQGSKKTQEKQKAKVIEDKTFGLKNKKGSKQQKFIKTVQHQVAHGGAPATRKVEELKAAEKLSKKDAKEKQLEELNLLFRPVQGAQKVSAGADPKSVLCAFFKQGHCGKGNKCKFSHDLSLERKSEKRSLYVDPKDADENDTMENWDQDKLEEVVNKKHGEAEKRKPKTDIICKHFLEAIDRGLYGWFWACPAGEKCFYKHALPPGFVLKKKEVQKKEGDEVSLEELIEKERANLSGVLTPVTLESFKEWKTKKIKEKKAKLEQEINLKKEDFKQGRSLGKVSGREMFLFKPELADDDDDEATDDPNLYRREDDDDVPIATITLEELAESAQENTVGGTKVGTLLAKDRKTAHAPTSTTNNSGRTPADVNGLDQACASVDNMADDKNTDQIVLDGVPVEESLFEDDVDDLELEDLEIAD